MQDVALRRRVAALVLAALLAMSGAALASAYFADEAHARNFVGTERGERIIGTDSADTLMAVRGGGDNDHVYGDLALNARDGDNRDT